jgi:hypothetical protein
MRTALALGILLCLLAVTAPLAADNDAAPAQAENSPGIAENGATDDPAGKTAGPAKKNASAEKPARLDKSGRPVRLPGITAGREAAVMTFVREHHPELEALLVYLKKNRSADFERAFRELFGVSERLARIQEQDDVRYELELSHWKLQSRIQLLAARLKMEQTEELREQLRAALEEQVEVQIAIAQRERQRMAERLERLDARIERLQSEKTQLVETQLRQLTQAPRKSSTVSTKDGDGTKEKQGSQPRTSAPK